MDSLHHNLEPDQELIDIGSTLSCGWGQSGKVGSDYGLSSLHPNHYRREMGGRKEVPGGLVVACGGGSILLELGKEILNQMPRLVEMTIEDRRFLAVRTP